MSIRIVVADDHKLVRAGIAALLCDVPDVEVVGQACDGFDAVKMVAELSPDILLLDLAMPGMTGLEALAKIHESQPDVRVIIISMHDIEEHVLRAFKLGAMGFMLKDVAPEELVQAIMTVNMGNTWLSTSVSNTVVSSYLRRGESEEDSVQLTARQSQVLKMIAEGYSMKKISVALDLSVKTIETFRTQIMRRLDIHDIAGLVRYAIRQHIISP
jgi:DNA-binding NarL/FixJ family response regulator